MSQTVLCTLQYVLFRTVVCLNVMLWLIITNAKDTAFGDDFHLLAEFRMAFSYFAKLGFRCVISVDVCMVEGGKA